MFVRVLFLSVCLPSSAFNTPKPIAHTTSLKSQYLDSISSNGSGDGPSEKSPSTATRVDDGASVDLNNQITDRQSNLFFRDSRNNKSVNEDPRPFDLNQRFSQPPSIEDTSLQPRQAWWDNTPTRRIQGGSRHTFNAPHNRDVSHVFLETDGRPLDTEIELWDGPNNTPTRLKVYSEDGRLRPVNAMVENPQRGVRGNTMSVRNTGAMEFPINAQVGSVVSDQSMQQFRNGGSLAGGEGSYLSENDLNGFTQPALSNKKGQTVQGGALSTFPLDYSVEAVQVTLTTDGLPMNAKVELWGTSSHIKQVAEIYNDNGQSRPFSAIVDTPGGSNTVAIYNTGPMEYPIKAIVEPIARNKDWDGSESKFGGSLAPW